ncbi:DTW domain-containing protein [Paraphysoderma sedebokerense]|nr:DTW domain-containing protein [Paraphysoderma sedebokerense]
MNELPTHLFDSLFLDQQESISTTECTKLPTQDAESPLTISDEPLPYDLHLPSPTALLDAKQMPCPLCTKPQKYYCSICMIPLTPIPNIPRLPFGVEIWKHKYEGSSKSTGVHAKILSRDVQLKEWCKENQETIGMEDEDDVSPEETLLLYPGLTAQPLTEIEKNSFRKVIVLEGTWAQAKQISRHSKYLRNPKIRHVTFLNPPNTKYWRYQNKTSKHLATIEAVWWLLKEFELYHGLLESINRVSNTELENLKLGSDDRISKFPRTFIPQNEPSPQYHTYDGIMYYYSFFYQLILHQYRVDKGRHLTVRLNGDFRESMEAVRDSESHNSDNVCGK